MVPVRTLALALTGLLLWTPGLSGQQGPGAVGRQVVDGAVYERAGSGWVRLHRGRRFAVAPDMLTVVLAEPDGEPGADPGDDAHADPDADPHADVRARLAALAAGTSLSGLELVRSNRLGIHDVRLPPGSDPLAAAATLAGLPGVVLAEPQATGRYLGGAPDDTLFDQQWNLHNTGQDGGLPGADVNALSAWDLEDGDPSVVVAVLDSGANGAHPDLAPAVALNDGEIPDNGVDDDDNGFVDDHEGWHFVDGAPDPTGLIDHGTWVASVVAARGGDGFGMAGLAGGARDGQGVRFLNLNVGDFGPDFGVLDDAILYAVDRGARVVQMSLFGPPDRGVDAAVAEAHRAGVLLVNSAGNTVGGPVVYPSELPEVVAVGATDRNDTRAFFSAVGPEIDLVAPGEDVLMASIDGGHGTSSGTSFAAPHVSAAAALIFSAAPQITAEEVRDLLTATTVDLGSAGPDEEYGHGRLDARAALEAALASGVLAYGQGLAGTGGVVPRIGTRGSEPRVGAEPFGLVVADAPAGATAWLLLGGAPASLPFKGGTLLVDTAPPSLVAPYVVGAGGGTLVTLHIGDDPELPGLSFYAQWVVEDAGAKAGWSFTQGLELVVGF